MAAALVIKSTGHECLVALKFLYDRYSFATYIQADCHHGAFYSVLKGAELRTMFMMRTFHHHHHRREAWSEVLSNNENKDQTSLLSPAPRRGSLALMAQGGITEGQH